MPRVEVPIDPFGSVSRFVESANNLAAMYPVVAAEAAIQRGRTNFYVVVEGDLVLQKKPLIMP